MKEKDNTCERLLKEKDNVLKEKDNVLKEKDNTCERLLKEKDDVLKEKDNVLKEKDNFLKSRENELMSAKGLLTSRGLLERIFQLVHPEVVAEVGKRFVPTAVASYLDNSTALHNSSLKSLDELFPQKFHVQKVLLLAEKSGLASFQNLYSVLSSEIHGYSWSGPAVRIFSNNLPQECIAFIKLLASDFFLLTYEVLST